MFDPGDNNYNDDQQYPAYVNAIKTLNLNVEFIEGEHDSGYQPTLKS